MRRLGTVAILLALFPFQRLAAETADLVLRNGKIVTVDATLPEAQALAVNGDRIVAVGSDQHIQPWIGPQTQVIDLDGKLAMPGFIEGHGHFVGLGQSQMILDLTTAKSWSEIVEQVRQAAATTPPGEWIHGRGWHQSKWAALPDPHVEGYPLHRALSDVTPLHPVLLKHASGHLSIANQTAMELSGVDEESVNPRGGEILRDEMQQPTGVLRETAQQLIKPARRSAEQQRRDMQTAIELATRECLAKGITSFQDAGSSFATIDVFRQLARRNELGLRLWVMVRDSNARLESLLPQYRTIGDGSDFLNVRSIKLSIDGALGAHGAWLLEPYSDLPSSVGLNTTSIDSIRRAAELAVEYDYQLCIHAIGDRANREALDIFAQIDREFPADHSRRWRIEHAQHLSPRDVPRFAELGVIASMQGVHCTSDGVFVVDRLGESRAREGAYVWQSLIQSGAVVINGTDAPVEDVDPLASFHASITRRLANGHEFFPEQCMSREQALRSYTSQAAYAAFEEDIKGSLTPGKLADIVILSNDIMTCPASEILNTRVLKTILGGQVVFEEHE